MIIPTNVPIKLTSTRAWRTYLGGRMLDAFYGKTAPCDSHFPEEWISSLVSARNAGRENLEEGLSHLADQPQLSLKELIDLDPSAFLGPDHFSRYKANLGVLLKLIDAGERLTIQVQPDRDTARCLFGSPYGKTEGWHILGGRTFNGEPPCLYLGFKEGITRSHWEELFQKQDITGMLKALHRFTVKAGDTVLIEGGVPHAIGLGCWLVEIQEPTDYTIRIERTTPAGYKIADSMCHQGLGFERMFDCFHYEGLTREAVQKRWFLQPSLETASPGSRIIHLIRYEDTPFFRMDKLEAEGSLEVALPPVFSSLVILAGQGTLRAQKQILPVKQGDQFFIPARTGSFTLTGTLGKPLQALHCFGPKV